MKATGRGTSALLTALKKRQVTALRPLSSVSGSKKRPIAPHVQIYAFPIAAITSITNRATGVALSVAAISGGLLSAAGVDVVSVIHGIQSFGPLAVVPVKAALAFPLAYHAAGGIRHLYWDHSGKGLDDIKEVDQSSYAVIGAAVIVGGVLTFI
eukprot:TRINITY_DN80541_c0_g1_i1.p1 TRINITY_DN80541_c0_g1~~TRINITY_DN80541_c0_g1_i1.p1  ORF type:complete len:154 (-),score=40.41 TRINITY_DN80541_c0_g1_i1:82-543(-)